MSTAQATITLAGRKFRGPGHDLTVAQDDYINARLRLVDAFLITQRATPGNIERCMQELLTKIMLSGLKCELLAGLLTEVGKSWNKAEADRNAQTFAGIVDQAEKLAVQTQLVDFVLGFMGPIRRSLKTSPNSSAHGRMGVRTGSGASTSLASSQ